MRSESTSLPTISVVTPSFNQARYLRETLASVAAQTYPAHEHIVMDGGSTDGSVEVLREWGPRPGFQWHSGRDRGQSDAINKGVALATGEIVGWLNSDDLLYDGALDAIARAFAAQPDAGVVYGTGEKMDPEGRTVKIIPAVPYDARRLRSAFYVLQPSMFFRRALFQQVGGLDENSHYAMDWELLLKLARIAPVIGIPDPVGRLRVYGETKSNTGGWARMREIANIGRRMHGPLDRNWLSLRIREIVARIRPAPLGRLARKIVDATMRRTLGEKNFMVQGWPS